MKERGMINCMFGLVISTFSTCCMAQTSGLGARSVSMSGICTMPEDLWAVVNNPSGIAGLSKSAFGFCLEQRYAMKELGYYGLLASLPIGNNKFGIFGIFSGYKQYISQSFGISYGRSFGSHMKAGLGLLYRYQKSPDSRPQHLATYHIGTIIDLSAKLKLGFSALNPFQVFYKSESYISMASIIRLALAYHHTPALLIHAELEKDLDQKPVFRIGMEYMAHEVFIIRGGFRMFPAAWSFGAAFHHKNSLIEIAASYHYYLGFTPAISMQYFIKQ